MARNRIIYQSEGLYVGPTSGEAHNETLENGEDGRVTRTGLTPQQLSRIQSINYGFDIPRQDVNQFGQLARIDQVILEQPTVDLDFTYYTETGFNDRQLGFHVGGTNALGHFISGTIGKIPHGGTEKSIPGSNFYIRTSPEGDDLNKGTNGTTDDTIGIGNAFVTNWTTEAAVGGFPTTSVTAEGLNMKFYVNGQGSNATTNVPSVNPENGASVGSNFLLPQAVENGGNTSSEASYADGSARMPTALRPGSIVFHGDILSDKRLWRGLDANELKIQSFSISADMSRENLEKLGSKFAYSKELEFPLTVTLSMEAIVSDAIADDLEDIIAGDDDKYNMKIAIKGTAGDTWSVSNGKQAIGYQLKGLKTDSMSFSSAIGDNKTVSLTATAQIGAGDDTANGLFIYSSGVKMNT